MTVEYEQKELPAKEARALAAKGKARVLKHFRDKANAPRCLVEVAAALKAEPAPKSKPPVDDDQDPGAESDAA